MNNFAAPPVESLDALQGRETTLAALTERRREELEETVQILTSNPGKPARRRRRAEGIDSEPGAFAKFAVRLPRRDPLAAAGRAA